MSQQIEIRPAEEHDVPAMAAIRAREWQNELFWTDRIGGYLKGEYSPQQALRSRATWVAVSHDTVVGFVAGHLTRRFDCEGELEWINVVPEARGKGIADRLMMVMLEWFRQQGAAHICVNVEPENEAALRLYAKHGAVPLSSYWMVWKPQQVLPGLFDLNAR